LLLANRVDLPGRRAKGIISRENRDEAEVAGEGLSSGETRGEFKLDVGALWEEGLFQVGDFFGVAESKLRYGYQQVFLSLVVKYRPEKGDLVIGAGFIGGGKYLYMHSGWFIVNLSESIWEQLSKKLHVIHSLYVCKTGDMQIGGLDRCFGDNKVRSNADDATRVRRWQQSIRV
jgi:hypothetical protein